MLLQTWRLQDSFRVCYNLPIIIKETKMTKTLGFLIASMLVALAIIAPASRSLAREDISVIMCENPAPPFGYHYEGGDPETQCAVYLVPDGPSDDVSDY